MDADVKGELGQLTSVRPGHLLPLQALFLLLLFPGAPARVHLAEPVACPGVGASWGILWVMRCAEASAAGPVPGTSSVSCLP